MSPPSCSSHTRSFSEPLSSAHTPTAAKARLIKEILSQPDLYLVLGAPRTSTDLELRRAYLDRSKIVHPDKRPSLPDSTAAFQRLSHAYEVLKKPSLRAHYDRESTRCARRRESSYPGTVKDPLFVHGESTFRSAVLSFLSDFLNGDFLVVTKALKYGSARYPNMLPVETLQSCESAFETLSECIRTTSACALIVYVELGRIYRVQRRLWELGYFDVVGRVRVSMQLVRVTLAVPVRVDRALQRRGERVAEARREGWCAAGLEGEEEGRKGYLLSERVVKVLEFVVGNAVEDMPEDCGSA